MFTFIPMLFGLFACGEKESDTAIDTETDEVMWELSIPYSQNPFTGGVRPLTFTTNPDGSTRSMLVNVGGWHGFCPSQRCDHIFLTGRSKALAALFSYCYCYRGSGTYDSQ